ncbi:MAG TPA: hypothetical protein VNS09_26275 [Solirubrobacter sp.]|nr:hypothetical protein [Solirubrobacter sp.]
MKARLKRWLSPRRWLRGLRVLAVAIGVAGAVLATWVVLDKDRWFPELAETSSRVDVLESRIDDLEAQVTELQGQLGDEDTSALSSRIADLEGARDEHGERLDDIEGRADDIESDTSDLDSRVNSLEPRVDDIARQAADTCSELQLATDYETSC